MPLTRIVVVRHSVRLDSIDKTWVYTSATPYDPPLAPEGEPIARQSGSHMKDHLSSFSKVYIHSSPFLRCAQTSALLASSIGKPAKIRLDGAFGEWLTSDYYSQMSPPPPDNHAQLACSSYKYLHTESKKNPNLTVDSSWPVTALGTSGDYDEPWTSMHNRFKNALTQLISLYESEPEECAVIIVTHGAGCNALLGHLTNEPVLSRISVASYAVAQRHPYGSHAWDIIYNSNNVDSPRERSSSFGGVPQLCGSGSNSASTSSSSVSDLAGSPPVTKFSPSVMLTSALQPDLSSFNTKLADQSTVEPTIDTSLYRFGSNRW